MPVDANRKPPDDGARTGGATEGARYEVVALVDGRHQVTLDRGTYVVMHAAPAAAIRPRVALDADARDRAAIAAALPAAQAVGDSDRTLDPPTGRHP